MCWNAGTPTPCRSASTFVVGGGPATTVQGTNRSFQPPTINRASDQASIGNRKSEEQSINSLGGYLRCFIHLAKCRLTSSSAARVHPFSGTTANEIIKISSKVDRAATYPRQQRPMVKSVWSSRLAAFGRDSLRSSSGLTVAKRPLIGSQTRGWGETTKLGRCGNA
jgi:hypothetical protein